jgi:hypothetical protein
LGMSGPVQLVTGRPGSRPDPRSNYLTWYGWLGYCKQLVAA